MDACMESCMAHDFQLIDEQNFPLYPKTNFLLPLLPRILYSRDKQTSEFVDLFLFKIIHIILKTHLEKAGNNKLLCLLTQLEVDTECKSFN